MTKTDTIGSVAMKESVLLNLDKLPTVLIYEVLDYIPTRDKASLQVASKNLFKDWYSHTLPTTLAMKEMIDVCEERAPLDTWMGYRTSDGGK